MTDRPPINYRKNTSPAATPRPLAPYLHDPSVNPYASEEYPMPLIYQPDDDSTADIAQQRAAADADYNEAVRSYGTGVLPLRWYFIGMVLVATIIIVAVAVANLVAS